MHIYTHFTVQGSEIECLKGATDVLRTVDVIILEISFVPYNAGAPRANKVIAYMDTLGFDLFGSVGNLGSAFYDCKAEEFRRNPISRTLPSKFFFGFQEDVMFVRRGVTLYDRIAKRIFE
jgi:hypothetical protein